MLATATHLTHVSCAVYHLMTWPISSDTCIIVTFGLDYCSAMLYGAPVTTFDVLQWWQNDLTSRLPLLMWKPVELMQDRILLSLHWLPVKQWATCSMLLLMFKVLVSSVAAYLSNLIKAAVPVQHLQSSIDFMLSVLTHSTDIHSCLTTYLELCIV